LDGDHRLEHVRAELDAYAPLVSIGSYIVAADGVMERLADVPGGQATWRHDNPAQAAREFAARRSDFALEKPEPRFKGPGYVADLTYFSDAWLRRTR
jgi:cephalosporin hydroxylase